MSTQTLTERPSRSTLFDGMTRYIPIGATVALLLALYFGGVANYRNFEKPQVIANLFIDNAPLLVIAVGMTFVILSGGIDLSVGSVMAFSTMILAPGSRSRPGFSAPLVVALVLVFGTGWGLLIGAVIHYFNVQPFIATLVGLFLFRGLTLQISTTTCRCATCDFFQWGDDALSSSAAGSARAGSGSRTCRSRRSRSSPWRSWSCTTRASGAACTPSAATSSPRSSWVFRWRAPRSASTS